MKFLKKLTKRFKGYGHDYNGLAVRHRILDALNEPAFRAAYDWSTQFEWKGQKSHWSDVDLRWRVHFSVWAAKQALQIPGDLVECGVDTGLFSGTVVRYLGFEKIDRKLFLFDTFTGIPDVPGMAENEARMREKYNATSYFDSHEFIKAKMKDYPNVVIVQGFLPDTLDVIKDRKIAFLAVDLNNAPSEKAVAERLWPQLSPGAIVLLDDYAHGGHQLQYNMWNDFAAKHGIMVATLPTGQGLLIKPH